MALDKFTQITKSGIVTTINLECNHLYSTGIATFSSGSITAVDGTFSGDVSIGGTLTYQDVTNIDAVGLITARAGVKAIGGEIAVGAGFSVGQAGVVTATKYYGDGSSLTGISAGVSLANGANNRVITATGAAALTGETNLTYDGTDLVLNTASGDKAVRWATGGNNKWSVYHNNSAGALCAFDNANNAERLRIDSSGKVGIGTDNPNNPLTIHASGNHIYLKDTATNNVLQIRHASGVAEFNSYDLDGNARRDYVFNQYSSEVLRIDSSGSLLIGTNASTPLYRTGLQVVGGSGSTGSILIRRTDDGTPLFRTLVGQSGQNVSNTSCVGNWTGAGYHTDGYDECAQITMNADGAVSNGTLPGRIVFFTHKSGTGLSEALRIDSSGRLLKSGQAALTSTSLSHSMQVAAASDANAIAIFGRASDDIGELSFYEADKSTKLGELQLRTNQLNLRARTAGADINFATVPSGGSLGDRMTIKADGKIGINQASPDGMLHIFSASAGSVNTDGDADELTLENSGNVGLSLLTAATGESSIYFGNPGTNGQKDAWIKYYHESHSTTANRRCLSFKSGGGSEKMRLTAAGSLNIGAASPTSSENGQFNCYTTTSSGKAQFVHDAGTGGLRLAGTGSGSGANLVFSNNYNSGTFSDHWTLTHNGGDDSFRFLEGGTGGTERLRIQTGGDFRFIGSGGDFYWKSSSKNTLHTDDVKAKFGTGGDLEIFHNATNGNKIISNNGILRVGTQQNHLLILGQYYNAAGGGDTLEIWGGSNVVPSNDNDIDLGETNHRWDDIYATNSSIQTSDRNDKDNITASDLGLSFVNKLSPKSYKFKGKTRTHYGLISQDVETVLSDISKPTSGFAGFVKTDSSEAKDGSSYNYGLRYGEFIGPLIKAVQELSAEVETLKTEVAALKAA